ncbi:hypothetical protein [Bordetella bronchiseptica]|uniref:hypothetical protein n=1 Tax=Bordetella bronchiseptica TaxID=518 RepID=UPI0012695C5C|nr:hypothetical protein [Bordetella bronchiseptica]
MIDNPKGLSTEQCRDKALAGKMLASQLEGAVTVLSGVDDPPIFQESVVILERVQCFERIACRSNLLNGALNLNVHVVLGMSFESHQSVGSVFWISGHGRRHLVRNVASRRPAVYRRDADDYAPKRLTAKIPDAVNLGQTDEYLIAFEIPALDFAADRPRLSIQ